MFCCFCPLTRNPTKPLSSLCVCHCLSLVALCRFRPRLMYVFFIRLSLSSSRLFFPSGVVAAALCLCLLSLSISFTLSLFLFPYSCLFCLSFSLCVSLSPCVSLYCLYRTLVMSGVGQTCREGWATSLTRICSPPGYSILRG